MKVDMQLLKQLRDATHAPLKDCKEALVEATGDFDKAQEILKEKGVLKAAKKADRETNEGVVKLAKKDGWVAGVTLLCETDFVAKNDTFQQLVDNILDTLLSSQKNIDMGETIDETLLTELQSLINDQITKIGENVQIGDVLVTNQPSFVYNHPGNKVAAVVYHDGDEEIAKELALQIAAMNPTYLSIDDIPQAQRDDLAAQYRDELRDSGKPENIVAQIVDGKVMKELSGDVLLEQEYIRDGSKKVKDILSDGFTVRGFVRFAI